MHLTSSPDPAVRLLPLACHVPNLYLPFQDLLLLPPTLSFFRLLSVFCSQLVASGTSKRPGCSPFHQALLGSSVSSCRFLWLFPGHHVGVSLPLILLSVSIRLVVFLSLMSMSLGLGSLSRLCSTHEAFFCSLSYPRVSLLPALKRSFTHC